MTVAVAALNVEEFEVENMYKWYMRSLQLQRSEEPVSSLRPEESLSNSSTSKSRLSDNLNLNLRDCNLPACLK